jgi:multidrug efflux pump subunit AcrA (membrane-fusion protein)
MAVPVTAIQSDSTGEYVNVINNNATQRVNVVSGKILADDTVVITGDVKVGDQVELVQQTVATTTNARPGGFFLGGGGRQP